MIVVVSNDKNLSYAVKKGACEAVEEYFREENYYINSIASELAGLKAGRYIIDLRQLLDSEEDIYISLSEIYKMTKAPITIYAPDFQEDSKLIISLRGGGFKSYIFEKTQSEIRDRVENLMIENIDFSIDEKILKKREEERQSILEEKQKVVDAFNLGEKKQLKIAVVGSQRRIGTTTASLTLAKALSLSFDDCCYLEINNTDYTKRLISDMKDMEYDSDLSLIKLDGDNIFCDPKKIKAIENLGFNKIVYDYGELTEHNIHSILEKDIVIAVVGAKAQELPYLTKLINKLSDFNHVFYLYNFIPDIEEDRKQVEGYMGELKNRTFFLGYNPDETRLSPENKDMYEHMIKKVSAIINEKPAKRKTVFRMLFGK